MGGFLREAREVVAGIAAALAGQPGGAARPGAPGADAAEASLKILTHRLRGSAALYGLPRLAALAGAMEELVVSLPGRSPESREMASSFLDEALGALRETLAEVERSGRDGAGGDGLAVLLARYPALFAPVSHPPLAAAPSRERAVVPPLAPPAPAAPATLAATGVQDKAPAASSSFAITAELQRFGRDNPEALEYFGPEAEEHIEAMAGALGGIAERGAADELMASLFREVHTLKGAAYLVGCAPLGRLAHLMEDLLAELRARRLGWGEAAEAALFGGVELLRQMLAVVEAPAGVPVASVDGAYAAAAAALGARAEGRAVGAFGTESTAPAGTAAAAEGAQPQSLEAASELGGEVTAELGGEVATAGIGGFRSSIRVSIDRIDRLMSLVGDLVVARSRLDRRLARLSDLEDEMQASGTRMNRVVEEFRERHLFPQLQAGTFPAAPTAAAAWADGAEASAGATAAATGSSALSLSSAELFAELEFDRYDEFNVLARRVGEVAADLSELHSEIGRVTDLLRGDAGQLQRLTRELRSGIGRARMVPIGQLFARYVRLIDSAAAEAGKQVELSVEGEAVEVDTAVAEMIADPLLHLIQNAVIHGIEPPDVRGARGKPPRGTLLLRASIQGRYLLLEIEDDGAGIDAAEVRREALAQGLRSERQLARLGEQGLLELIFLRGLSTSRTVTRTAGRGVGLDVALTNLLRIGGHITTETELGGGTQFTLKVPLTLVVSEALFLRVGGELFAIPVTAVRKMLFVTPADLEAGGPQGAGGGESVRVGEEQIELHRLGALFGLAAEEAEPWMSVLVIEAGARSCALAVDQFVGIEEVVIKGLGDFLEGLTYFSGATLSSEGRLVLLLDATAFGRGSVAELGRHSDADAGAEAAAALPVTSGPADPAEPLAPTQLSSAAVRAAATPALLIVDDSLSVRRILGQLLTRHGFAVTSAVDGEEALELLRERPFDVVLTDLEMPGVDGYQLIEDLRRRPATRELPVVVITTRGGDKHAQLARQLGVSGFFAKPFDEGALLALLHALTARPPEAP